MPHHHNQTADERRPESNGRAPTADEAMIVLVVVPDADMRLYLRGCLHDAPRVGRVIEASDGIEALTLARAGAVDFVITDSVLPRLDGSGLCAAIQDDSQLDHIPVLVLRDDRPDVNEGDGFLTKPFNTRQLRDAVRAVAAAAGSPHSSRIDLYSTPNTGVPT